MGSIRASAAPIEVRQLGTVGYDEAWQLQRDRVAARVAGGTDTLLLLEHPSVYTAGRRTQPHERPVDGTPVVDTDRGGKITWHGPGQLVGYPIIGLADPIDVVNYVRRLEESLIAVCTELGPARAASRRPLGGLAAVGPPARSPRSACGCSAATTLPRLRAELRLRPGRVRPRSCRAASPTPGSRRSAAELGRRVTVDDVRRPGGRGRVRRARTAASH